MNYVEQKLFINELKYEALSKILTGLNSSVEEELQKSFEKIYETFVSRANRERIDYRIAKAEEAEQAAAEAGRRFAVYHLHDSDDDYHFIDELRNSFLSAASTYKGMIEDGVLNHTMDSIAHECFGEHQPIDALTFMVLCDAKEHDERINAVIEFDFDVGKMIVSEGKDESYIVHELKNIEAAIDYAFKNQNKLFLFEREKLFKDVLSRIEAANEANIPEENTAITPQM